MTNPLRFTIAVLEWTTIVADYRRGDFFLVTEPDGFGGGHGPGSANDVTETTTTELMRLALVHDKADALEEWFDEVDATV